MRKIQLEPRAFKEYSEWATENKSIFNKITKLIEEIIRHPFEGGGKPEPLKYQFHGCWSRRINDVHRLVYKADDNTIVIYSCKYHY